MKNDCIENQATISKWAIDTFGRPVSAFAAAARAGQEVAELGMETARGDNFTQLLAIAEETADVAICLFHVATYMWIDVVYSVERSHAGSMREAYACFMRCFGEVMIHAAMFDNRDPMPQTVLGVASRNLDQALSHLAKLCAFAGEDLNEEIDLKMIVNRARKWQIDENNNAQHIGH